MVSRRGVVAAEAGQMARTYVVEPVKLWREWRCPPQRDKRPPAPPPATLAMNPSKTIHRHQFLSPSISPLLPHVIGDFSSPFRARLLTSPSPTVRPICHLPLFELLSGPRGVKSRSDVIHLSQARPWTCHLSPPFVHLLRETEQATKGNTDCDTY